MTDSVKLSLVITAKDPLDPRLQDLYQSIWNQDFDMSKVEILTITEGTSESAKAIGIRKTKGEVIGILATDNVLIDTQTLRKCYKHAMSEGFAYPAYYYHCRRDNVLNRYFALVGCNDPVPLYLGKNDRFPYYENYLESYGKFLTSDLNKTFGDNGFFVKKSIIIRSDLDNYYHIDNIHDVLGHRKPSAINIPIWHKTGGKIIPFFKKRYHYALKLGFNKNRRWHMVNLRDIPRLIWFILASLTLIEPLILSVRGYRKVKDVAWFIHPIICLLTVATYTTLLIHLGLRKLYQSSFARLAVRTR
jgi:hypothetical protein